MKNNKARLLKVAGKPRHEKLPWPGLKAKDHLSRVVTRAVKEAKETRENEAWAKKEIALVLNYVTPARAMKLLCKEARRQRRPIRRR